MTETMHVRSEEQADRQAVRELLLAAFPSPAEADVVEALRERAAPLVSLVAQEGDAIVGHIVFSPVTLPYVAPSLMGLGPMAVFPSRQCCGIGSALVLAGLGRLRRMGVAAVVVLGHPDYYPRFGFAPAARFGLDSEYTVSPEAFMLRELRSGALTGVSGTVRYHPAFAEGGV